MGKCFKNLKQTIAFNKEMKVKTTLRISSHTCKDGTYLKDPQQ